MKVITKLSVTRDVALVTLNKVPASVDFICKIFDRLDEEGIRPVDYKETEHYILTRKFLNDPQSLLRYLWDEKE